MGADVRRLAEQRVGVKLLAAELPWLLAGGGSRCRNAEKSFALTAVDHAGKNWSLSHTQTHAQTNKPQTDTRPHNDAKLATRPHPNCMLEFLTKARSL